MSDTSEIKASLCKILSESPSQYGFVDFIRGCTLLNDVEPSVAQQLMEAFIAKYSQYDRYNFYFAHYKPWGSHPKKATQKEANFCLNVVEKMLVRDNHLVVSKINVFWYKGDVTSSSKPYRS